MLQPKMDHDWLGIANRLERFRNRHHGQQLVLICNGPSLNKINFKRMRGKKLMGLNKIFLGFKQYKIYPLYYVAVNQEVLSQSYEQIRALKCVNFIPAQAGSSPLQESPYTHWIKADLPPMGFSLDLCNGIHQGWTVTHVALQIAYFMGFKQVVIIGMDHRYCFSGKPNELANLIGPDPNHFSQDYFQDHAWNNPDLPNAEEAFGIARHVYEAAGRSIIDCTEDGACEVFLKRSLDEVLL